MREIVLNAIVGAFFVAVFTAGIGLVGASFTYQEFLAETSPYLRILQIPIGVFLILSATIGTSITVRNWIRNRTIRDLDQFVEARENYKQWKYLVPGQSSYDRIHGERYLTQFENRFKSIGSRRARWLAVNSKDRDLKFDSTSDEKAIRFAEILRANGYLKGRLLICKELRVKSD
ncbi:MAG: hypothetical protein F4X69_15765 [Gemmatimonadetes bacterium]|nr:hypothetical protein [Gemmatimonadota bacterium]